MAQTVGSAGCGEVVNDLRGGVELSEWCLYWLWYPGNATEPLLYS